MIHYIPGPLYDYRTQPIKKDTESKKVTEPKKDDKKKCLISCGF